MRYFFGALVAVVLIVLGVALVRTVMDVPPAAVRDKNVTQVAPVDAMAAAKHLASAVKFRTVSYGGGLHEAEKDSELDALRGWLQATYPNFHRVATREIIGKSLLFTWPGKDRSLAPVLLMAHMDVVPVVPGTEKQWTHDPFGGEIEGGYVWGRGAIDDKGSLIAIFEAAERLAAAGFTPKRTIMFAFGQDEEVGGTQGNANMASILQRRATHFLFVHDEGGTIQTEPYPGVHKPVAVLAIAEKGYLSLELVAHGTGGHSSRPSQDLAIERLAKAVVAVMHHPFSSGLDSVQTAKLSVIAPYTDFKTRFLLANLWLTSPFVVAEMNGNPVDAARLHTTISPTIIQGGVKDNVLPPEARAVINFRLHPRDTIASVMAHVKDAIDDPRVDVNMMTETHVEASAISDMDGASYKLIVREIGDEFAGVPVAPDTTSGATDSRHYRPIADAVFGFDPFHFGPNDSARVHGTNERLAVSDLAQGVAYFQRLMMDVR